MSKVIQLTTTVNVTSLSGKVFPLTISGDAKYNEHNISSYVSYNVDGVRATIEVVDAKPCVVFQPMKAADAKPLIKYFPTLSAKNRNCVAISAETEASILAARAELLAPHKAAEAELKATIKAEQDAMPTQLVYEYGVYWGDYSTDITSQIIRVRHLTDREKQQYRGNYADPARLETAFIQVERLLDSVIDSDLLKKIIARPAIGQMGTGYEVKSVTEPEVGQLRAEWQAWKAAKDEAERPAREAAAARKAAEDAWVKLFNEKVDSGKALFFWTESAPHDENLSGVILNAPAPNDGSFMLSHRVERTVWSNLKEHGNGRYYDREMLEDFDMFNSPTGWRYGAGAIRWALENGYEVYIDRQQVTQVATAQFSAHRQSLDIQLKAYDDAQQSLSNRTFFSEQEAQQEADRIRNNPDFCEIVTGVVQLVEDGEVTYEIRGRKRVLRLHGLTKLVSDPLATYGYKRDPANYVLISATLIDQERTDGGDNPDWYAVDRASIRIQN